jgi:ribokinase
VIQIDESGQNNIIICGGANRCVDREDITAVLDYFGEGDMLLLQNEISNIAFAMEEAKRRGLLVAFNPSPADEGVFECDLNLVDYFILNEVEGKILAGIDSEEPDDIMNALKDKYPEAAFMLTLGDQGCRFFNKEETLTHAVYPVKAVDTTAAGDTFCGYFIAGIAQGLAIEEILDLASAAGAIAVTKKGAAPSVPTREEVETFLAQYKK